jgi:polysaccharide biosynthesis/export protein
MPRQGLGLALILAILGTTSAANGAQQRTPGETGEGRPASAPLIRPTDVPPGYVIGAEDLLSIVFWRDKDLSADVVVRPDGNISLPLLNDVRAEGLTPDQLREALVQAAAKYIADPNATVLVKEINSRKVFITGNVAKPGSYPLAGRLNVMQLIALAGGLQEYADSKKIIILRAQKHLAFNFKDVVRQKNVGQNILLEPGDTVVVP